MNDITLTVPDVLGELPGDERDLLFGRAIRTAAKERVAQIEQEVADAEEHIRKLEKKYNLGFSSFEEKIQAQEFVGSEFQEDYNDWFFWIESKQRAERVLTILRQFLAQ